MSKPIRIQLSRKKGWRKPENTVVVARPSKWGNPIHVGWHPCANDGEGDDITPAKAVALYRAHVSKGMMRIKIRDELRGKNLACWCPLWECRRCGPSAKVTYYDGPHCEKCGMSDTIVTAPCHADVLLEIANS